MQQSNEKRTPVYIWRSRAEAIGELQAQVGDQICLDGVEVKQIERKIALFASGLARRGVDFKTIRRHSDLELIELRWDLNQGAEEIKVRLLGSLRHEKQVQFVAWHVKSPKATLEEQRRDQNAAIELAAIRLEKLFW